MSVATEKFTVACHMAHCSAHGSTHSHISSLISWAKTGVFVKDSKRYRGIREAILRAGFAFTQLLLGEKGAKSPRLTGLHTAESVSLFLTTCAWCRKNNCLLSSSEGLPDTEYCDRFAQVRPGGSDHSGHLFTGRVSLEVCEKDYLSVIGPRPVTWCVIVQQSLLAIIQHPVWKSY